MPQITLSPGTVVDDASVGTEVWGSPNNAKILDNSYATLVIGPSSATSHYLKSTSFGFAIPTGTTIDGIFIEFTGQNDGSSCIDSSVKIIKSAGALGTVNKSKGVGFTDGFNVNVVSYYGSPSDLWGEAWTPADINSPNFGVALSLFGRGEKLDNVRATVYYSFSPTLTGIQSLKGVKSITL